jgi:hypothetical protein
MNYQEESIMKRRPPYPALLPFIFIIGAALACSFPGTSMVPDADAVATSVAATMEAIAAATTEAEQPEGAGDAIPTATLPPPEGTEPEPTPTITIVHLIQPGSPGSTKAYVTDRSSASFAAEKRTIGDNFNSNLLERPFTSQEMNYLPYLDITRGEVSTVSPWMYFTIFLEEGPPAEAIAMYGLEIDLNLNGRGDRFIQAVAPPSSEWTTDGVQAFKDANFNVGGGKPMLAEQPPQTGDGYEVMLFDQGIGDDPDLAWVRIAPGHPDRIQIAFKLSFIGNDDEFTWNVWTDEGVQHPDWFDYNDHFSVAEAGSPVSTSSYYPLNALAAVDNSCRWTYGFDAIEPIPGLCSIPATPTPEPSGRISGIVFNDRNNNGSLDGSDSRFSGVTVRLKRGPCTGYSESTSTNSSGYYQFSDLPAGTYCITARNSDLPGTHWDPTVPDFPPETDAYIQIELGPGEDRGSQNFGFFYIPQ